MCWASYMDATYGGPVHGKGFCFPAGVMPAYNIPDAEGNVTLTELFFMTGKVLLMKIGEVFGNMMQGLWKRCEGQLRPLLCAC